MNKNAFLVIAPMVLAIPLSTPSRAEVVWSGPNQPDSSTLALFHFDESGPRVLDSSQRGYELPLGNESSRSPDAPQWSTSPEGRYLTPTGDKDTGTTGITETLEIPDVDFNQGLTISFWYQPRPDEPQSGELFQMEGPRVRVTTDDFGPGANGRIRLIAPGCTEDSPSILADSGAEPRWRHVAVVYDPLDANASNGGKWTLFLDGTEVGASEDPDDLSQDTNLRVRIGGNVWNNAPLQGVDLDEFLVANKVITDFENPAR